MYNSAIHASIHVMSATATFVFVGIPVLKSSFSNIPAPVAEFLCKFMQNVFKYDAVNVLAQKVYKEPITDVRLGYHLRKSKTDKKILYHNYFCSAFTNFYTTLL